MRSQLDAVINYRYITYNGDIFVVIGHGTNGVIVEYKDGRVELVSRELWTQLSPTKHAPLKH